jgi:hypothetical protein
MRRGRGIEKKKKKKKKKKKTSRGKERGTNTLLSIFILFTSF